MGWVYIDATNSKTLKDIHYLDGLSHCMYKGTKAIHVVVGFLIHAIANIVSTFTYSLVRY